MGSRLRAPPKPPNSHLSKSLGNYGNGSLPDWQDVIISDTAEW